MHNLSAQIITIAPLLSSLLLRGAPDYSINIVLCRSKQVKSPQTTVSEGFAQGPYVPARVGFEPVTLRTEGTELTNEPPRNTVRGQSSQSRLGVKIQATASI